MSVRRLCKGCGRFSIPKDAPKTCKACSIPCAAAIGKAMVAKQRTMLERSRLKQARADKRERSKQKKEFYQQDVKTRRQAAVFWFNKYIRLRDTGLPCISCNKPYGTTAADCGHFITAGSCTALRFDERNCNLQCHWDCNIKKSGNLLGYRKGILIKYGQETLDRLEGPQPVIKITVAWYQSIEDKYKALCKELQNLALPQQIKQVS